MNGNHEPGDIMVQLTAKPLVESLPPLGAMPEPCPREYRAAQIVADAIVHGCTLIATAIHDQLSDDAGQRIGETLREATAAMYAESDSIAGLLETIVDRQ